MKTYKAQESVSMYRSRYKVIVCFKSPSLLLNEGDYSTLLSYTGNVGTVKCCHMCMLRNMEHLYMLRNTVHILESVKGAREGDYPTFLSFQNIKWFSISSCNEIMNC